MTLPAVARNGEVALYDAESDKILRHCLSGSVRIGNVLELINCPSQAARRVLSNRHKSLVQSLAGFDREVVADAVTEVLGCYSQYHRSNMDKKSLRHVVVKYVAELHGLPTWACVKACDSIRMGTAANISPTYPPSTIEVKTLAQSYTAPIRSELEQIGSVLQGVKAPPQLTPDERKALGLKFQGLADEIRGRTEAVESDRPKPAPSSLFDASRFILREWGSAVESVGPAGLPISKALVDRLKAPRERHGW